MTPEDHYNFFGYHDNMHPAYAYGNRRWLMLLGLTKWRFVRRLLGGRWEQWFIPPCSAYLWFPVYTPSDAKANIRPIPFTWPLHYFVEDYT